MPLFPEISAFIATLDVNTIHEHRKMLLQQTADAIATELRQGKTVRLNFICTHNSRRSHLAQVWAQVMAFYYSVNNIFCYSGGTEATALYPAVLETLQAAGLQVYTLSTGENPVYSIKYASNEPAIIGFSKTYDHPFNPASEYFAMMTCSQAEQACPIIYGAQQRIALMYDDPKLYDGMPLQSGKYQERSREIATEFLYIFSLVKV